MNYLLDTDIIVNQLRGKERIQETYIQKGAFVSIITYAELLYGAHKSNQKEKSLQIIHGFIKEFGIDILSITQEIAHTYARIKSDLEHEGKRLDDFDLLIAATAVAHSLILATKNVRHFQRIPQLNLAK